jgi:hypothetical protein
MWTSIDDGFRLHASAYLIDIILCDWELALRALEKQIAEMKALRATRASLGYREFPQ